MRTRRLIVVTPEGERELLFIGRLTIGRAPECDISLADTKISRRHAEFDASGPMPRVTDLGSRNGILVNGRKVGAANLVPGDVVTVGDAASVSRSGRPSCPSRRPRPAGRRSHAVLPPMMRRCRRGSRGSAGLPPNIAHPTAATRIDRRCAGSIGVPRRAREDRAPAAARPAGPGRPAQFARLTRPRSGRRCCRHRSGGRGGARPVDASRVRSPPPEAAPSQLSRPSVAPPRRAGRAAVRPPRRQPCLRLRPRHLPAWQIGPPPAAR